MGELSLEQIYLWKRNSCSCFSLPWQRKYLNIDFLEWEKKRINDVTKWYYNIFQKAKNGDYLEEVWYYVLPNELDSSWKASIALDGEYNYVGLSALRNSEHFLLTMLIPKDKNPPKEYSLIRIIKSKKHAIFNKKNNQVIYVIIAEDFEEKDPSLVYLGIPYEKKSIQNFFNENFKDESIAQSFQPVLSGAPYVTNKLGGVSLSTFFIGQTSFSTEFIKTLKLMQPIEFTDLKNQLPKTAVTGIDVSSSRGISFHLAEKSVIGCSYFKGFSTTDYSNLNTELINRKFFLGEYSVACSLNIIDSNASEMTRDIISKFIKTEVTHATDLDEFKDGLDLSKIQQRIDEDLWLQIINQKQIQPKVSATTNELNKYRKKLVTEGEILLEELGAKRIGETANILADASFDNLKRVAQSVARDYNKEDVDETILKKAYEIFKENAERLRTHPVIQHYAKITIPKSYETEKFWSIYASLSKDSLNIKELYEIVKKHFRDIYELQEYIDKLVRGGRVYQPKQGIYSWV